jgi:hypothetical protein
LKHFSNKPIPARLIGGAMNRVHRRHDEKKSRDPARALFDLFATQKNVMNVADAPPKWRRRRRGKPMPRVEIYAAESQSACDRKPVWQPGAKAKSANDEGRQSATAALQTPAARRNCRVSGVCERKSATLRDQRAI